MCYTEPTTLNKSKRKDAFASCADVRAEDRDGSVPEMIQLKDVHKRFGHLEVLKGIDLTDSAFAKLTPCVYCGAPARPETLLERYLFEAEQIGFDVPEDIRAQFGLE